MMLQQAPLVPAKAGTQSQIADVEPVLWIPDFAGMSG
jgi:hypothetical protein